MSFTLDHTMMLWIGQFRLGADCNYEEKILDSYTIAHRGRAYKPGDD